MIRGAYRTAFAALFPLLLSGPLAAQEAGALTGQITGPDLRPLADAQVAIPGAGLTTFTDRSGTYHFGRLPAGPHEVVVRYLGFRADTIAVSVAPHALARGDVSMRAAAIALDGLTIEGERGAQLRAINQQRLAVGPLNVMHADEIGKLPDQNVAEAVQRLPGVSMQTSRGEGRFVTIRGTSPRLNSVTVNGQALASTAESRATALDLLPASMVSSVKVIKAVTPDMDANAIGGTVDIETVTAFDVNRPFLFGSVEGLMHQRQVNYGDRKLPFELMVTGGRRVGPQNTLGLVVSATASRRDFAASVLDPDGWEEVNGSVIPEELELQVEDNERQRYALSTNFDWRPSERTQLYLRGLFTHTNERSYNSEYEFGFEGDLENQTPTTGRYTAGSAELDLSTDVENESLFAFNLGGSQKVGPATWTMGGTFTRGVLDRTGPDATFETDGDLEDRLAATYDVGKYFFDISPEDPGFISQPGNYPLRTVTLGLESNVENTWVASTDLRFDANLGRFPAFLKLGGKLQARDKVIDDAGLEYEPGAQVTTLDPFALPATGTVQGGSSAFVHGDVARFRDYFEQNRQNPGLFVLNDEETALNAVNSDSDNEERILAGYAMAHAEVGPLTISSGVRLERSSTSSRRWEISVNEDTDEIALTDRRFSNRYTNLLPAVLLRYKLGPDLVLRAAWTNTLGRPDYEELAGFREVNFAPTANPNEFEGSVSEGNPGLRPFEAGNIDLFAEYYFRAGGLLSAGLFHKRIDNPIYEYEITRRDVDFEGRFFREITFSQDRNAEGGTIQGLELSWQQPLMFLPSPFNGLGIAANAAFIRSHVVVPGREDRGNLPFFGQSDRVFNLTPYFRRGGLELRVALAYQSPFLIEVGEESFEDRYTDQRHTWDVSASYDVPRRGLRVFAQVRNLTNQPEVGYQGIQSRYDVHTLTGRTFTLGLAVRQ